MHFLNATQSVTAVAHKPWVSGWSVSAAVVAVCLACTACGSSRSVPILNTARITRAIEQSSLTQRGKHVHATCPPGVKQEKGLVFYCTAVYRGGSARFVVTELDDSGQVRYVGR
jgi:hypothetical protein